MGNSVDLKKKKEQKERETKQPTAQVNQDLSNTSSRIKSGLIENKKKNGERTPKKTAAE